MLPLTEEAARDEAVRDAVANDIVDEVADDVVNEKLTREETLEDDDARAEVLTVSEVQEASTPPEAAEQAATEDAPETVLVVENVGSTRPVDEAAPEMGAGQNDEDGMASSTERMTILRMVEQGKISAEDGARLLAALSKSQAAESKPRPNPFDASRQLQVRVYDLASNRAKVNVTVPVGLLQWAWRWLPAEAQTQLAQVQAAIESGASGRLVEVVDQESSVRVEITLI